jgi:signal transduction histidine kinase
MGKKDHMREDLTYVEISNAFALEHRPDELRIFDRYYRQENVMTKPGMGIGLSIVKTSLEKLDGEIHFSIEGQRAIFKLVL